MEDENITKKYQKCWKKTTLYMYWKNLESVFWCLKILCIAVHQDIIIRLLHYM